MGETIFEEMKRFVRFGPEDERMLRLLAPHATPHFNEMTEAFYGRLAEHEQARLVFANAEQVQRLKQALSVWMTALFSGPWDEAYFQSRARIGTVHVRIGVAQRYVCGAMELLRRTFTRIAAAAFASDQAVYARVSDAVHKILNIDLAIILEAYEEGQIQQVKDLEQGRLAALRTLTAGLAHEVRNPLNAAHLQLTVAKKRLGEPLPDLPAAQTAVAVASDEVSRLGALVAEFLEFAAPRPPRRQNHDLRAIAETIVAAHTSEASTSGRQVLLLPGEPATLAIDGHKIEQALRNLIKNALEATGPGGRVWVRLTPNDGDVSIDVEDDGPGLSAPVSRLFEPFFTTKSQGTGLGLSLVHRIVTDHGGEVSAARRGDRTVFTARLPRSGSEYKG